MNRVVIIVNKKWEAAPVLAVFRAPYAVGSHASARPFEWQAGSPYPGPQMWPDDSGQRTFDYRYTLQFGPTRVECWCLADFEDTSDSGKKSVYIPQIVAGTAPDLVIAVGTAASVEPGLQGSVIVGCRALMHDPKVNAAPTQPEWPAAMMDKMLESAFAKRFTEVVAGLPTSWGIEVHRRFLRPPNGRRSPHLQMNAAFVALGDVNVQDYIKYKITDPQTVDACRNIDPTAMLSSIETTTALIRAKTDPAPFLFVSGIANELGFFGRDVGDTEYAQNFAATHNPGVVLAWLLPLIVG